ncbi:hypothetical protein B0H13DRAFT_2236474 [Mycena leptocephala]|nr:hypothetical protein B0H13DRAFT_2236474 [Mycena leptocephala]
MSSKPASPAKPSSPAKNKAKVAPKKALKTTPSHPTWNASSLIRDARHGVSRPQIKKFVETKYKLAIGPAQNTQLSKALATGSEKTSSFCPKVLSVHVVGTTTNIYNRSIWSRKLAPKAKPADASAKENKPTKAKPKTTGAKRPLRLSPRPRPPRNPQPRRRHPPAKQRLPRRPAPLLNRPNPLPRKLPGQKLAGKAKPAPAKKTTTASKRAPAKKVAHVLAF